MRPNTRWTPSAAWCAGESSADCSWRAADTAASVICRSTCADCRTQADGCARLHVEVEVANFHPAIATRLGKHVYNATQAKIHVFVTNGFLRSLARLDLAESRMGQFEASRAREQRP